MRDGRRAARCASLLLVALAGSGCSELFDLHEPLHADAAVAATDASDGGITVDAASDAATACASPILYEGFAGALPCAAWGNSYASGTQLAQANGMLTVTPSATAGSVGGCVTPQNNYSFGRGVTVRVNEVLQGAGAYTIMQVHGADLQMDVIGGALQLENASGTSAYASTAYSSIMKWWRIRPSGSSMIGEYSTDGVSWTLLATRAVAPPLQIGVEIAAGSNNGGNVGQAAFDQLMICP